MIAEIILIDIINLIHHIENSIISKNRLDINTIQQGSIIIASCSIKLIPSNIDVSTLALRLPYGSRLGLGFILFLNNTICIYLS